MSSEAPKRILHIVGAMTTGGVPSWIMNLYRVIDRTKYQFDFAVETAERGSYEAEIAELGGRIFVLPLPKQAGMLKYRRVLRKLYREQGPFDAVHSHVHFFSGVNLRAAAKAGIRTRIAHSHTTLGNEAMGGLRKLYYSFMRGLLARHATRWLGCSKGAAEALFGAGCWTDARTEVIANAVDIRQFAALSKNQLRQELGLPEQGRIYGHVGRLDPVKNHLFLLHIFQRLLAADPAALLLIVGEGAYRADIERFIEANGLGGNVRLLGERNDISRWMGAMDVFILPSLYEGLPFVLVEAQSAGLPCVVADTVSRESDFGLGLVHFVPLQAPVETWEQRIESARTQDKPGVEQRERVLAAKGYDIYATAKRMEQIYAGSD